MRPILGSAREFGETANWRGLERFGLPGIAGLRIPALNGRSEAVTAESNAVSESLEYWNSRILRVLMADVTPDLTVSSGRFGLPLSAACEPSHHRIEFAR